MLFPLEQAGEIFTSGRVMPVPHTQAWFAGVANLRGGLHGVVDLAVFLGLRARGAHEHGAEGARLVALNPSLGVNCALLVDRLAGLRTRERSAPSGPTRPSRRGLALPARAGATRPAAPGRKSTWPRWRLTCSSWRSPLEAPHARPEDTATGI